ncbi:RluA family pseudouridine synthase [Lactobacillus sp. S2-2]|uniref:RluA family pseudouridine synthase n=1 Tax=Lactobacillus sp. S2-2 TaxID=2692917 RepID=UPI001F358AF1|nr:RluA family pseudouridine synthase [Lactobacillus sp. S2-2]MCF6515059.1 RluA family pseudouridine synthase [Lactobacillus sp. S2-2]
MSNKKINLIINNEVGRLDKVISEAFDEISRSRAQNLIENNFVDVNEHKEKPKYKVQQKDRISIEIPEPEEINLTPQNIPLDIIYEDEDVIVINKPEGMVVHPSPGHPDETLVNALLYHTKLSPINGSIRPGIVHRIDKDTSGLLMVAKSQMAHESLSEQLKNKTNKRKYIALVHGNIKEQSGTIKAPIGRSKNDRKKQAIVSDGRFAETKFNVLKRFNQDYTLIECELKTGRTHQIRVHMKYIGHPLVGDPLYGPRKTIQGHGQFLHAKVLGFKHPKTNEDLLFEVPLPEYFEKVLNNLKNK